MPERIGNIIVFDLYYNEAVITQILGAVNKKNGCKLHLLKAAYYLIKRSAFLFLWGQ